MKDSDVYLRAAELCSIRHEDETETKFFDDGCCEFIDTVCLEYWGIPFPSNQKEKFVELFQPKKRGNPAYWMGPINDSDANKSRVLALCFMAAIAKSEGR